MHFLKKNKLHTILESDYSVPFMNCVPGGRGNKGERLKHSIISNSSFCNKMFRAGTVGRCQNTRLPQVRNGSNQENRSVAPPATGETHALKIIYSLSTAPLVLLHPAIPDKLHDE